jgi:cytoskeletal protein CcmA (bactofilin family)
MEAQKLPISEVCTLAQGSVIDGNVKVAVNLRLEGEVKGNVDCGGRLVLSKTAIILGSVTCGDLITEGKIIGDIVAKTTIVMLNKAEVNGDIKCSQLQIDNGVIFNGKCTMHKSGN